MPGKLGVGGALKMQDVGGGERNRVGLEDGEVEPVEKVGHGTRPASSPLTARRFALWKLQVKVEVHGGVLPDDLIVVPGLRVETCIAPPKCSRVRH